MTVFAPDQRPDQIILELKHGTAVALIGAEVNKMKENMKNVSKSALTITLFLALGMLTACGGSSSKKKKKAVTTISCNQNSIQNAQGLWQLAVNDGTRCNPINTIGQNGVCGANDFRVRVPVTGINNGINNGLLNNGSTSSFPVTNFGGGLVDNRFQNSGLINNNQLVTANPNFHRINNGFSTTCIGQDSRDYRFVRRGNGYFYFDIGLALTWGSSNNFTGGNTNYGFGNNVVYNRPIQSSNSGRRSSSRIGVGTITGAILGALVGYQYDRRNNRRY